MVETESISRFTEMGISIVKAGLFQTTISLKTEELRYRYMDVTMYTTTAGRFVIIKLLITRKPEYICREVGTILENTLKEDVVTELY